MTSRDDLIELSDFAWQRLRDRMGGLTDEEYFWEPVPNCRTVRRGADGVFRSDGPARRGDRRKFSTLAWRLCHIVDLLREDRNGPWLGRPGPPRRERDGDAGSAAEVLGELEEAYRGWREILEGITEESLGERISEVGGYYARSTRRAFVLHVLDELIHHGAEAALMRDLYAARTGG